MTTREELVDEVYSAMDRIQDMDTTLKDYARAAVDCLAASMDEQIKSGLERVNEAMRAKGFESSVDHVYRATAFFSGRKWIVTATRRKADGGDIDCFGDTFAEAIDGVLAKIADLPPRWTPEQVAATLGIGVAA